MVSIIVLHHNKATYSQACLHSIRHSSAPEIEVINVDNGSKDATPMVLDEWESRAQAAGITVQRLTFETNIGAINGRNAALAEARGDYLVFLDNDTLVAQADWLEKLCAFLDADENRGIVAPQLLFPWPPFAIECGGCGVSPQGRIQYIGRGEPADSMAEPQPVQCAISAAWMMTRHLYETIGPLDEIYSPVQYEDLDYCYRAREAGFSVWVNPDVQLFHFEHTTTAGSGDINFKYVTTKNGITFKKRWGKIFHEENGPSEDQTQWRVLEKQDIAQVDWHALLPSYHRSRNG